MQNLKNINVEPIATGLAWKPFLSLESLRLPTPTERNQVSITKILSKQLDWEASHHPQRSKTLCTQKHQEVRRHSQENHNTRNTPSCKHSPSLNNRTCPTITSSNFFWEKKKSQKCSISPSCLRFYCFTRIPIYLGSMAKLSCLKKSRLSTLFITKGLRHSFPT